MLSSSRNTMRLLLQRGRTQSQICALSTTSTRPPGDAVESTSKCFATEYVESIKSAFSEQIQWNSLCNTVHTAPPKSIVETLVLEEEEMQRLSSSRVPLPDSS
ncbi:hypothetical protein TrLO_g4725 [Triparma laevis f. longispina]|uniref:Uncharacterized protein n=1 Tax=Triparma laevis f. longispina TaxID=1714387 RepID=A0A9W7FB68_9STRA|nr:hypothetical protein TrLO_g4725 [Triparma laevis f. longispina]